MEIIDLNIYKDFKPYPEFDLYTHLKSNIKNTSDACSIHDSDLATYCFICRSSVCDVCKNSYHTSHICANKKEVVLNCKSISNYNLNLLENIIKETEMYIQPKKTIEYIKNKVIREFDLIMQKLINLKYKKLEEIENILKIQTIEVSKISSFIKLTNENINEYLNNTSNFYCFNEIKDTDNFVFLSIYDFLSESISIKNNYIDIIDNLKKQLLEFESNFDNKLFEKIEVVIDECNEEQDKINNNSKYPIENNVSTNKTLIKLSTNFNINKNNTLLINKPNKYQETCKNILSINFKKLSEDQFEKLRKKLNDINNFILDFKNNVYSSYKKHGSLNEIKKILTLYEEKTSKRIQYNNLAKSIDISQSKNCGLTRSKQNLNLSNISTKINKNISFSNYKAKNIINEEDEDENENKIYNNTSEMSYKYSDENLEVEINKNKMLFNNKNLLKINNMFKPKQKNNVKTSCNTSNKINSLPTKKAVISGNLNNNSKLYCLEGLKENIKVSDIIKNKDNCNLKIPTINRYYSFSILEFIRNNFYKSSKHNDDGTFSIFNTETKNNISNIDHVKVIEGSNEIHIYKKIYKKLIKKNIPIDKKTYGTDIFYNGCRTFFSNEKLYISGGKDTLGDKKIFWMYDIKKDKLEKLNDMLNARSFHSFFYHENLRSLIVFGGENNSTCEMYDFYLNSWSMLPNMNYPRANVQVYIDKVGTFAYAICGILGSITSPLYSDNIEILDLVDVNNGWAIVDYNNKSNVDLKMNENILYPLTDDKLLIYGASENRNINKVYCIFDIRTFILQTINEDELGHIKIINTLKINANKNKVNKI